MAQPFLQNENVGDIIQLLQLRVFSAARRLRCCLQKAKLVSAASVGLGLLSSGLKKFAAIGSGAVGRGRSKRR